MEKYFIAHRHFSRSRRFITLAVFHFQIEMSRNYPISLFIITSNTFSVQFHTGPWFIAVARWTDVCWQHGSGMSPNPLGTRYQAREQHGKFHSETHPRKQLIYILFIHFFLSCPVLFQTLRAFIYIFLASEWVSLKILLRATSQERGCFNPSASAAPEVPMACIFWTFAWQLFRGCRLTSALHH